MKENKIESFLDTVYSAAEEKSQKMIREIDSAGNAAIREYRADLRRSTDDARRREDARAAQMGAEKAAREESEIRSSLLSRRDGIAEEVFSLVRGRLEEYRKTSAYREALFEDAKVVADLFAGKENAVLLIGRDDESYAAELESAVGISVQISDSIIFGGIIGKSAEIECDCTLDTRMAKAREDFARESGLSVV